MMGEIHHNLRAYKKRPICLNCCNELMLFLRYLIFLNRNTNFLSKRLPHSIHIAKLLLNVFKHVAFKILLATKITNFARNIVNHHELAIMFVHILNFFCVKMLVATEATLFFHDDHPLSYTVLNLGGVGI